MLIDNKPKNAEEIKNYAYLMVYAADNWMSM